MTTSLRGSRLAALFPFLTLFSALAACATGVSTGPDPEADDVTQQDARGGAGNPWGAPLNDAGKSATDAGKAKSDGGGTSSAKDSGTSSVVTGGTIQITCPSTGFHQRGPVVIASLPLSSLPRCSTSTLSCVNAATTNAAYDACLAADTTPSAVVAGEPVNCAACDRTQGSYCLASSCKSEFSAYACCSQATGGACTTEQNAMIACAKGAGKAKYEACITSLVGACFM